MRTLISITVFLFLINLSCRNNSAKKNDVNVITDLDWTYCDSLVKTIQSPSIPEKTFTISPNAAADDIQKAIDKAALEGGGTVKIPKGTYLSNPVNIKSNVQIFLEEGAILKFIPLPEIYPLVYTWFEGIPCMNYSSMIYAKDQVNIKISGNGIIDGQGNLPVWKNMKYSEEADWDLLKDMEDEGVSPEHRSFGKGHSLRPDLITLVNCKNIEISGVTILNAPYLTINPILCEDLTISHINIKSSGYDQTGISPQSSSRIIIENVKISETNDGIRIRSGRVKDPSVKPSEDIIIRNSEFNNIENDAIALGSKVRGGVSRVFISGITINGAECGLSILLDAEYKGFINEIFVKDIIAGRIAGPFIFCGITNASSDQKKSDLSNLKFENLNIDSCSRAFIIDGSDKQNVCNISISNSGFNAFRESLAENVDNLNLEKVEDGGKQLTLRTDVEDVDIDELDNIVKDNDILDTDDISFNDLNEAVKQTINEQYTLIPIENIERIITKTGVNYDIRFELENSQSLGLIISSQGDIIRSEKDIRFNALPLQVNSTLKSIIKEEPSPYLIDRIKKIAVQDFTYYEIAGETRTIIFLAGISEDGSIIEAKQKQVKGSLQK